MGCPALSVVHAPFSVTASLLLYLHMPVGGKVNAILQDIAKSRQNIQQSLSAVSTAWHLSCRHMPLVVATLWSLMLRGQPLKGGKSYWNQKALTKVPLSSRKILAYIWEKMCNIHATFFRYTRLLFPFQSFLAPSKISIANSHCCLCLYLKSILEMVCIK